MTIVWIDDTRFRVDGVDFVCSFDASTTDVFCIRKERHLVDQTVALLTELRPERIVELGIAHGGSAALISLVARPRMHVALELAQTRVPALDELIRRRGLDGTLRPFYGIDQGDRARLRAIVADQFDGSPLDLVVDDASHRLAETRASFETVFPSLRPGATYVIEDWNWQQRFTYGVTLALRSGEARAPAGEGFMQGPDALRGFLDDNLERTPLEAFVLELVLTRACAGEVVQGIAIDRDWVSVRRGRAPLDPTTFRIADHYVDPHGLLGRVI
jgi:predicted O-methyltransferase YrrM